MDIQKEIEKYRWEIKTSKKIVKKFFKLNEKPIELSDGQALIFACVYFQLAIRVQVLCSTQYGKSFTIALAVICRSVSKKEMFNILAPSEKKAKIIMGYVIDHIFDHELFVSQLELDSKSTMEKLKRERSKNKITWLRGGGVQTLTLDARNGKKSIESAMGFGGNRIIVDEASLIDDKLMSSVIRMLGGYAYQDTFLLKIGNPFYRNHFFKTWNGERYTKLFIDYKQALLEGRYDEDFIDEMREEEFFDVYYECKFPDENVVDERGFRVLVSQSDLDKCEISEIEKDQLMGGKLGIDVGGGGDKSTFTLRKGNFAKKLLSHKSIDTHINVEIVRDFVIEYELEAEDVFLDDTGIGRGLSDYCVYHTEDLADINPISNAGSAEDSEKYANVRAENYFRVRRWVKKGGKIENIKDFKHLPDIKFKKDTSDRLIIEKKEDIVKRIGRSPDNEDSLTLTFGNKKVDSDIYFI